MAAARTRTRKEEAAATAGSKRVTTAIVLRSRTLTIIQRVAAMRGSMGQTEASEAGIERPYSVSALLREIVEAQLPAMEKELKKAGIVVPLEEDGE